MNLIIKGFIYAYSYIYINIFFSPKHCVQSRSEDQSQRGGPCCCPFQRLLKAAYCCWHSSWLCGATQWLTNHHPLRKWEHQCVLSVGPMPCPIPTGCLKGDCYFSARLNVIQISKCNWNSVKGKAGGLLTPPSTHANLRHLANCCPSAGGLAGCQTHGKRPLFVLLTHKNI